MRRALLVLLVLGLPALACAQIEPPSPADAEPHGKAQLTLDPGGHVGRITDVVFTPDGKQLVTAGEDKTIQLWDVATAERRRVLRSPVGPYNGGVIDALALAPDGKTLAVGSHGFQRVPGDDKTWMQHAYLLNLDSGRILCLAGPSYIVSGIAFSHDGDTLAACTVDPRQRKLGRVFVWKGMKSAWKTPAGAPLEPSVSFTIKDVHPTRLAFSPDGTRLAAAAQHHRTALIWDLDGKNTAAPRVTISLEDGAEILHLAWSPDGKALATTHRAYADVAGKQNFIHVWSDEGKLKQAISLADLAPLQKQVKLYRGTKEVSAAFVAFRSPKELLAVCNLTQSGPIRYGTVAIDLDTKALRSLHITTARAVGLKTVAALAPDGRQLAQRTGQGNSVQIISLQKSEERVIGGHPWPQDVGWGKEGHVIAWKTGRRENKFDRLDLATLEPQPPCDPAEVVRTSHQRDGWEVKRADGGKRAFTVLKGGKEIRTMPFSAFPPEFTLINHEGASRLAWSTRFGLVLSDPATGTELRRFTPGNTLFWDVATSPDQKYLVASSDRELLYIYTPAASNPLLTLFVLGEDWIAWTAEGYYAATPGGEKLIGWTVNNGTDQAAHYYPAQRFRKVLFRPDVIKRVLVKGSVAEALKAADAELGKKTQSAELEQLLPPQAAITVTEQPGPPGKKAVTVNVKARAQVKDQPIVALRLFLDGRPLPNKEALTEFAAGKEFAHIAWTIDVPEGDHQLSVMVRSPDAADYSPAVPVRNINPAKLPALHVLAVGIDAYQDPALKLQFAAADARAIAAAFAQAGKEGLYRNVVPTPCLDGQATRDGVLKCLTAMRTQVKPNDLAVIFFAGHGIKKKEQFYLLTAEANINQLDKTALSGEDLRKTLGEFPCQVLLMLDACHAAGFGANRKLTQLGLRSATDDVTRALTDDECGVAVLCAAMGHEKAMEKNGHGLFTEAILQALTRPDATHNRHDHRQYIHHLHSYVFDEVKTLSGDRQHPFLSLPWIVESFPIRAVRD